jgi:ATP-dependent DNA helicase RecG
MNRLERFLQGLRELNKPVQYVKGVGPKLAEKFLKKGIATISDALYFLPIRYEDRRNIKKISHLIPGKKQVILGEILAAGESGYRKKIFEIAVGDGSGILSARWFNYNSRYMRNIFKKGRTVLLYGEVQFFGGKKEVIHPDIEFVDGEDVIERDSINFNRIVPVYSEIDGVYQKIIRRIMKRIIEENADFLVDPFGEKILERYNLVSLKKCFMDVHFPGNEMDENQLNRFESESHRRLIFDELFFLELGLARRKFNLVKRNGYILSNGDELVSKFLNSLNFRLTSAQERVFEELRKKLSSGSPMNVLLQGDVGSGKTVVAFLVSLIAVASGTQVAVMAPTEILAEQHYRKFSEWFKNFKLTVSLLTGDTSARDKEMIYNGLESGEIKLLVGTHALIQESVRFKNLGLCIIDEQHRFGVAQRAELQKKGVAPHVLVMTATPIPRTLSMTLYGDLDLAVIDELPPGRKNVITRVVSEKERWKIYEKIRHSAHRGEQAYIVYPIIEESEKLELNAATVMFEEFKNRILPELNIALLHGRMRSEDKEKVMDGFRNGEYHVLVSTTVIEVGIDIPNATLMVIEHAERFGLSQLHQLRGRIRRSDKQAECVLIAYGRPTDDAIKRLRIMEETDDGFRIAEEDLKIRGPGEFIGTRQSGMPDFRIANLMRDAKILADARKEAFRIIEEDPELEKEEHQLLRYMLEMFWKDKLEFARVG